MARRRYLVAYDIREPKRLRQVHKTMKAYGYALQYSVFICDLDGTEKILMRQALGEVIHHVLDSVVVVDLGDAKVRGVECIEFMGTVHALPVQGSRII